MSVTGYFESIINTWYNLEKRTPTAKRDMKEVLRQFNIAVQHDEIEKDKLKELTNTFNKIYKEVYNS